MCVCVYIYIYKKRRGPKWAGCRETGLPASQAITTYYINMCVFTHIVVTIT